MSKAIIEITIDENGAVRITGFGSEGEARQVYGGD